MQKASTSPEPIDEEALTQIVGGAEYLVPSVYVQESAHLPTPPSTATAGVALTNATRSATMSKQTERG